MDTKVTQNTELLAAGVHSSYVDYEALSYEERYGGLHDDDYYDDEFDDNYAPSPLREEPVKPSAYVPGTRSNWLREAYARMAGLNVRQERNIANKLFAGVRPETELPGEETPRKHIIKTQTANGLLRSRIGRMTFYSRKDLLYYAKSIADTYEDFELIQGTNGYFFRSMLFQCGYTDEHVKGAVFFAPFKTKFAERVLCFITEDDEVASAEFLDVVVRRVPATPIAAAEVPKAFYRGKRRVITKEEREDARCEVERRKQYRITQAQNAEKVKAYRLMLEMGLDLVAVAKELTNAQSAPASTPAPLPDAYYANPQNIPEDFFDGIEDMD
ncbi:hypothetical protein AUC43_15195 [Hymenobacter sedentarius]|uniref:Uncharacterized protein n=2 Tax=Hymenobacter sedentarius TaxID=1411621 RepID=A0A0U4ARV2_9BACT|nr:hypothetical protein AUC43_15195 [Hymenobacter sedentarius]